MAVFPANSGSRRWTGANGSGGAPAQVVFHQIASFERQSPNTQFQTANAAEHATVAAGDNVDGPGGQSALRHTDDRRCCAAANMILLEFA